MFFINGMAADFILKCLYVGLPHEENRLSGSRPILDNLSVLIFGLFFFYSEIYI